MSTRQISKLFLVFLLIVPTFLFAQPSKFNLRDGLKNPPPILSESSTTATIDECVPYSICSLLNYTVAKELKAHYGNPDYQVSLSLPSIIACLWIKTGYGISGDDRNEMQRLIDNQIKIVELSANPFPHPWNEDFTTWPCVQNNVYVTVNSFLEINVGQVKGYLVNGFPVEMNWYECNYNNSDMDAAYIGDAGPSNGEQNHCGVIIGWDDNDNGGAWKVQDCWGNCHGGTGIVRLKYGARNIGNYWICSGISLSSAAQAKAGGITNTKSWIFKDKFNTNGGRWQAALTKNARNNNIELLQQTGGATLKHGYYDGNNWATTGTFGGNVNSSPSLCANKLYYNLEAIAIEIGGNLRAYWRDDYSGTHQWYYGQSFGASYVPKLVPSMICNSQNNNLEVVVKVTDGHLRHFYRDNTTQNWFAGEVLADNTAVLGSPQLLQTPDGNLHVLVPAIYNGKIKHYERVNQNGSYVWLFREDFGSNIVGNFIGATINNDNGELQCVTSQGAAFSNTLYHYRYSNKKWVLGGTIFYGVPIGDPSMVTLNGHEFHVVACTDANNQYGDLAHFVYQ